MAGTARRTSLAAPIFCALTAESRGHAWGSASRICWLRSTRRTSAPGTTERHRRHFRIQRLLLRSSRVRSRNRHRFGRRLEVRRGRFTMTSRRKVSTVVCRSILRALLVLGSTNMLPGWACAAPASTSQVSLTVMLRLQHEDQLDDFIAQQDDARVGAVPSFHYERTVSTVLLLADAGSIRCDDRRTAAGRLLDRRRLRKSYFDPRCCRAATVERAFATRLAHRFQKRCGALLCGNAGEDAGRDAAIRAVVGLEKTDAFLASPRLPRMDSRVDLH